MFYKHYFKPILYLIVISSANCNIDLLDIDTLVAKSYIYDTIYAMPDTLYYTDTVYIEDILTSNHDNGNMFFETGMSYGIATGKYRLLHGRMDMDILNSEFNLKNNLYTELSIGYTNKSFLFSIGASFYRYNESIEHFPLNELRKINGFIRFDTVTYAYTGGIDTVWITEAYEVNNSDTSYKVYESPYYNEHNFISIPLQIGYVFAKERLNYLLLCKSGITFRKKNKNGTLLMTGDEGLLVKGNSGYQRNKVSITWSLLSQIEYKVSNENYIYFGVILSLNSFLYQTQNVKLLINPFSVSVNIGFRKYLNIYRKL